ncbi:MAG TPA: DUF3943 domain-containing protein [Longimicrobiales bacterium]|nr:DUF3943 domain-containing protein [Longimicrobiales bacterium]
MASCENKRTLTAVTQALGVNVVINRVDAWVFGWDWANVGFESWSRNLGRGWKWDANQVAINMFVHPYHGSLYFGAARANCLNFWESIPVVFLGSWTWEYFGETWSPSLNDFYTTGLGGPALGEILYRLSTAVLDEEAQGSERIFRETAAMLINPLGGLNRLVRGQWTGRGVNPVDRLPTSYRFNAKVGGRRVEETQLPEGPTISPTVLLDVSFGDVFETPYRAPFDVVNLLAQVSPDGGGLNLMRAVGRLWGTELTPRGSWHRHQLLINQRFDYVNNPVYHFGEQSLEIGIQSRFRTGPAGLRVTTRVAGDLVMRGAIQALDTGLGDREIDWGPGVGAIAELSLSADGTTYLSFYNRVRYLTSVSGVPADHTILFSGLDVTIPITRQLGIGAYLSGDRRVSDYKGFPDDDRSYAETRIYLTWTFAGSTPGRSR